ncbi:MAG: hypothetical protein VB133_11845 [Anaeromusa sp.]|uniref:hypothetical protein n=1 Tax=Anaeromusa sp. TaxID=1872520 RepID=UPI002B219406|nr:hypothetical protein [Anaeromusa sp.]MEA4835816.1 hypothetical protein [Anaeromusa sp.]
MKNINTVKYSNLTSLYFTARSFQNNYEHLKTQLAKNLSKVSYENPMPTAATNGFFALELYLKLIYAFEYWEKKERNKEAPLNSTQYLNGHNLKELFESIDESSQDKIVKQLSSTDNNQDLILNLDKYKNGFMEWRYFFERSDIDGDFHFLSDVLNSLYTYCKSYIEYKQYTNNEWSNDYPHTSVTMHREPVRTQEELDNLLKKNLSQILPKNY